MKKSVELSQLLYHFIADLWPFLTLRLRRSHYLLHPRFHTIIRSISPEYHRFEPFGIRLHIDKSGKTLDTILVRYIPELLAINLDKLYLVTIALLHFCNNLVPVFLEHPAPVAALHVKIYEDMLVGELGIITADQVLELVV